MATSAFANWEIEFSSGIPVYRQIENLLFSAIGQGSLREGDRLPTIRELADRFQINPNTVAKAYRHLDLKGVISSRRGDGSFVAEGGMASPGKLTAAQRKAKLDELFGRVVSEMKTLGITEKELMEHVIERMREDE